MKRFKTNGITLIALVVTIVVLLILAGTSISMLAGENGIINQAKESRERTIQSKIEEIVNLTVTEMIGINKGDTSGIKPNDIANKINSDYEEYTQVYAKLSTFPTIIIFPEEGNKEVPVNLDSVAFGIDDIYNVPGAKDKIAPVELFDYEIVDKVQKKARITGIKIQYCNGSQTGYNPETDENDITNTNYDIIYNGTTISDTLVIPYEVQGNYVKDTTTGNYGDEKELYEITEVNVYAYGIVNENLGGDWAGYTFPNVETIIYPNTVEKIYGKCRYNYWENTTLKKVVLSNNLKEIGEAAFSKCINLESITIPKGVISIGKSAFLNCTGIVNIKLPTTVSSIESDAFSGCDNLKTIIIRRNSGDTAEISGKPWGATNANVVYIDAEYEEFAINYVADKSQDELEELILKSILYTGTFEELLSEEDMTKTDLEQQAKENGMSYIEFLKFSLIYQQVEPIPWTLVEYATWLQGGSEKTIEELETLFVQKEGGSGTFDDWLAQKEITREQFEEELKAEGFRSEEDFLKCFIYFE